MTRMWVWFAKRKPRFNTNSQKFIFLSYGTLVVHIGLGWLLSNHFCKAWLSKLSSKFCHSTQSAQCGCIFCCSVVKAPANAIMQHKQWDKTNFDMPFTKLIAVQPSIRIWSQTRVSFYVTQSSYLLKTGKIVILTCFTKIIAEQSSVIQYAWPMCHMKEE